MYVHKEDPLRAFLDNVEAFSQAIRQKKTNNMFSVLELDVLFLESASFFLPFSFFFF